MHLLISVQYFSCGRTQNDRHQNIRVRVQIRDNRSMFDGMNLLGCRKSASSKQIVCLQQDNSTQK